MEILTAITIGFGLLFAGVLFLVLSFTWLRKDEVSHRLDTYVAQDEGMPTHVETSLMARRRELRGPFFEMPYREDSYLGEDLAFCKFMRQRQIAINVDNALSREIAHIGSLDYTLALI